MLFTSSTSKGNFTYLYLTDLDKLLQSVLQTTYTATRVNNLIEFGVITRNPKTLFKDNLPRADLDKDQQIDAVPLEFSKAFDKVPH